MSVEIITYCDECKQPIEDNRGGVTVNIVRDTKKTPGGKAIAWRTSQNWHYHPRCIPTKISEFELAANARTAA